MSDSGLLGPLNSTLRGKEITQNTKLIMSKDNDLSGCNKVFGHIQNNRR